MRFSFYDMFSNDPSPRKGGPFYKTRNTRVFVCDGHQFTVFIDWSKFRFLFHSLIVLLLFAGPIRHTVSANWRIVCKLFRIAIKVA